MVRTLVSHKRGPEVPESGVICGLSLFLVLVLAPIFSLLKYQRL